MEIEIPDNEELACALDSVETQLARQGQYAAAEAVGDAKRRIRADADEIAELRADLEWATGPRITTTGQSYGTRWFWRWSPERRFEYDGTPSDLRRVIRAARKG